MPFVKIDAIDAKYAVIGSAPLSSGSRQSALTRARTDRNLR
jgi:hypothetical protein